MSTIITAEAASFITIFFTRVWHRERAISFIDKSERNEGKKIKQKKKQQQQKRRRKTSEKNYAVYSIRERVHI